MLVVLVDTFSTNSPTSPDAICKFSTLVDKLLNATDNVCFLSSKYILVPFIVVLLSLFISVITLLISNLLPAILAPSATLESTIKPSAIALLDCIPF